MHADYVLLNKIDRVDTDTLQKVKDDLLQKAQGCKLYEVSKVADPLYIESVCKEICSSINHEV